MSAADLTPDAVYAALAHGDETHRAWLREAVDALFAGRPVPPPRAATGTPDVLDALKEIETICTESAGDCRRRMGTRVGNSLVTARAAIAKAEALRASVRQT